MRIEDFDYELPKELIAQEPASRRPQSRLMVLHRRQKKISQTRFCSIRDFLRGGDLLVINNTRVLSARLKARKSTGGKVECLLLETRGSRNCWEAMVKPSRRVREGELLSFQSGETARVLQELPRGRKLLEFRDEAAVKRVMDEDGELPLPPYVKNPNLVDGSRYQTVYAKKSGAVAAPTAGLHFDEALMDSLRTRGVEFVELTLYVGAGTFLPLENPVVEENALHEERYEVSSSAAKKIVDALEEQRRVIPVGTTSMRVLETLGIEGLKKGGSRGETSLFIYPGVDLQVSTALITNFHLPKTSLLCLVAAVAGMDFMKRAYRLAVEERYRFYSFGDAMMVTD